MDSLRSNAMKETEILIIAGAIFAALKTGLAAYKKRGKLDGEVIAEAAEALIEDVEKK